MDAVSNHKGAFDYIVVGGGSSGATLAGRMAQWTDCSVLLLEAGPDYRSSDTPEEIRRANSLVLQDPSRFTQFWWQPPARYTSRQDPSPLGRGKGIGGCSSVNCQVAIRGLLDDYDEWASDGCDGWSGKEVLRTFVRLESDSDYPKESYHGERGPLPITRLDKSSFGPIDDLLADAAVELGYGWSRDHNAPGATGASPAAMNSRDGVRVSTNDAYLEPVRDRGNLTVIGDALVDRVVFVQRKATGVRCRIGGSWQTIEGREIILSAGTFNSPAILLRSGVGPAPQVQGQGVDLVHDIPGVGEGLSDHAAVFLGLQLGEPARRDVLDGYPVGCLVRFSSDSEGAGCGDMGFGSFNLWGPPGEGCGGGLVFVTLFQTFSRGRVSLTSSNPDIDPVIEFDMLSDRRDLERMKDGVLRLLELGSLAVSNGSAASSAIGGTVTGPDQLPGPDEFAEWLLGRVNTIGHPCGTCRMGPREDPRSVVDPDCRVIGVENLRIADASVMPAVPRANNHLSCVMVAEHLAARMTGR